MKKIGILGGMGPQASLHFYQMLIEKTNENNVYPKNEDYPYILLSNIPVADLIKGKNQLKITLDMIQSEAKSLQNAGASFLVMPCNTMHLFKENIMRGIEIPFISMIECVVEEIKKGNLKKVGLLGSSTTMQSQLYSSPLNDIGVEVVIPNISEHDNISLTIHNYIAGKSNKEDVKLLEQYCNELVQNGAEAIVLGCTELPLILANSFGEYNFLASSEILANKVFRELQE